MAVFEDFGAWLEGTLTSLEGAAKPLMQRWQSYDALIQDQATVGGAAPAVAQYPLIPLQAPADNTNVILLGFAAVAVLILVTR